MLENHLICHPASLNNVPNITIAVTVQYNNKGALLLRYTVKGPLGQLCIPPAQTPGPADELWQHTCFELFIALQDNSAYTEFNFSPSGQWAVYKFSGYRQRTDYTVRRPPTVTTYAFANKLTVAAHIHAQTLPVNPYKSPLILGLSAVLECKQKSHSYWALKHPNQQPDFHHRDSFSCILAAF